MSKSTIFLVLSFLLMAQLAQSRYGPRGFVLWNIFEDGVRERVPLKNTIAQTSLVNEQMKEITRILKEAVTASTDVFQKVIMEANESENQSLELRAHVTNITLFNESVGRMLQAPEHTQTTWIFEEFEQLTGIVNRYNFGAVAHPSEEAIYFKRLLDQNDMPLVKRNFAESCLKLVERFEESIQNYIATLSPKQKDIEGGFITRFQKTTGDNDYNNMKWFETLLAHIGA